MESPKWKVPQVKNFEEIKEEVEEENKVSVDLSSNQHLYNLQKFIALDPSPTLKEKANEADVRYLKGGLASSSDESVL